jgi:HK97 family phage prohead protease
MTREIQLRDGFKVVEGHASCPAGKPWGVVRADGSLHPDCGCHASLDGALKHMGAFFDAERSHPGVPGPIRRPAGASGVPIAGFGGRREVRTWHDIEFRVVDQAERTAEIRVCVYNVVDDYGSVWVPGVWTTGLNAKLPKGTWAHDWADIIGRAVSYQDGPDDLKLMVKFSDFDAVPRALQAWTQLRDGDVDEFSFGFERQRWEIVSQDAGMMGVDDGGEPDGMLDVPDGCRERIIQAVMHEWSPVLVGAVPGTGVLAGSVRSAPRVTLRSTNAEGMVDAQIVGDLAVQLAAGEIDLLGALEKIREAAGGGTLTLSTPEKPKEPDKPAAPTTEPSGEAPVAPVSDAAAEATEQLLKAVTAEAQAAKAGAEAATQAEADALLLAADAVLDGMGRTN